jgi:hypothetical protein
VKVHHKHWRSKARRRQPAHGEEEPWLVAVIEERLTNSCKGGIATLRGQWGRWQRRNSHPAVVSGEGGIAACLGEPSSTRSTS